MNALEFVIYMWFRQFLGLSELTLQDGTDPNDADTTGLLLPTYKSYCPIMILIESVRNTIKGEEPVIT